MAKGKLLLLLCISLGWGACEPLCAITPEIPIDTYGHHVWKIEDFLGGFIYGLTQDRDGYVWLATYKGLFRFDGVRFVHWSPPPGSQLPSASVHRLLADADGSLWFGTEAGLSHWSHGRLTNYMEGEALVTALFQDQSGTLWFTRSSFSHDDSKLLCKMEGTRPVCFGKKDGIEGIISFPDLLEDAAGTLWMGTDTSVVAWKPGASRVYSPEGLRSNTNQAGVSALTLDSDGSLLVGISNRGPGLGLERFAQGKWHAVTARGFDGNQIRVTTLYMDKHHALWIGTRDDGIYRLYQDRVDHFTARDGLSGDYVNAIVEDREGTIWVATAKGLDHFYDFPVRTLPKWFHPKVVEFDNLVTARDGTLWVGTDGALFSVRSGSSTLIPRGGNLTGKQVTAIFEDRAGRMWVGLDDTLNLLQGDKFTPVTFPGHRPLGMIVSMAQDTEGNLWAVSVGASRQILRIDSGLHVSRVPELPAASKVAADPRGGLWLGLTTGELVHYANGQLDSYPVSNGRKFRIQQLTVKPDGSILAAAPFGLISGTGDNFQTLDTTNGLPCANFNDFVRDLDGNLWLYADCGLVEISKSEFDRWQDDPTAKIQSKLFDWADGVKTHFAPFEGAARTPDGRLWFNSFETLQIIDPRHPVFNELPPPVRIESVVSDRRTYSIEEGSALPPLKNDLEIDYTALSFVTPQKIQFRYKLSGVDPDWRDVGTRRQAFYMNLKPGTYSFQVIACNSDGVWNQAGDFVRFTIPPKFYQTTWFALSISLLGVALIYAVFLVRLRIATRLVESRMSERLLERERIARELHDTLLQGFQGIVLRLQRVARMLPASDASRNNLEEAMDRADEVLLDARRHVRDLRYEESGARNLAQDLLQALPGLRGESTASCDIRVEGAVQALKPAVQGEMLAIAKELLTNAFRHSQASTIVVTISFADRGFSLVCLDDGIGISPEILREGSSHGHWGLLGIRERASRVNARISFRGGEHHGTRVEVCVPARRAYVRRRRIWNKVGEFLLNRIEKFRPDGVAGSRSGHA